MIEHNRSIKKIQKKFPENFIWGPNDQLKLCKAISQDLIQGFSFKLCSMTGHKKTKEKNCLFLSERQGEIFFPMIRLVIIFRNNN